MYQNVYYLYIIFKGSENQKCNLKFRGSGGLATSEDQATYLGIPDSSPGLAQQPRTTQGRTSTDLWFMLLIFSPVDTLGAQFNYLGYSCSQQELERCLQSLGYSILRAASNLSGMEEK